jgi:hypothetical protein
MPLPLRALTLRELLLQVSGLVRPPPVPALVVRQLSLLGGRALLLLARALVLAQLATGRVLLPGTSRGRLFLEGVSG